MSFMLEEFYRYFFFIQAIDYINAPALYPFHEQVEYD